MDRRREPTVDELIGLGLTELARLVAERDERASRPPTGPKRPNPRPTPRRNIETLLAVMVHGISIPTIIDMLELPTRKAASRAFRRGEWLYRRSLAAEPDPSSMAFP